MPVPPDTSRDDEELRQYLLGLLPDETMERLDEAGIADDGVAARLRTVEADLIDDYVRGELTGAALARFESWYLSSARRLESVRRARSFVGAIDRHAARASSEGRNSRVARPARLMSTLAAAAIGIVVSGFVMFVWTRNDPLPSQAGGATAERRTADVNEPAARQSDAGESSVGKRESDRSPAVSTSRPAAAEQRAQMLVAVVLPPPTRAATPIRSVRIPVGEDRVRFELQLESDDFPQYRVGLKILASGQIVWRSGWVASSADRTAVTIEVPAQLFETQHYALELAGRGEGARAETIGSYTVRTTRP
jgi:hypothetical protein